MPTQPVTNQYLADPFVQQLMAALGAFSGGGGGGGSNLPPQRTGPIADTTAPGAKPIAGESDPNALVRTQTGTTAVPVASTGGVIDAVSGTPPITAGGTPGFDFGVGQGAQYDVNGNPIAPVAASQPGIDESLLWSNYLQNLRPGTAPIFSVSDLVRTPDQQIEGLGESGAGQFTIEEGRWTVNAALNPSGGGAGYTTRVNPANIAFVPGEIDPATGRPRNFQFGIKTGRDQGQLWQYELDPTGQYFVPAQNLGIVGGRYGLFDTNASVRQSNRELATVAAIIAGGYFGGGYLAGGEGAAGAAAGGSAAGGASAAEAAAIEAGMLGGSSAGSLYAAGGSSALGVGAGTAAGASTVAGGAGTTAADLAAADAAAGLIPAGSSGAASTVGAGTGIQGTSIVEAGGAAAGAGASQAGGGTSGGTSGGTQTTSPGGGSVTDRWTQNPSTIWRDLGQLYEVYQALGGESIGGPGGRGGVGSGTISTTRTEQQNVTPEAYMGIVRNLLEDPNSGLASIYAGQAAAGGYGGTVAALQTNDLLIRAASEIARLSAPRTIQENQVRDLIGGGGVGQGLTSENISNDLPAIIRLIGRLFEGQSQQRTPPQG
jgi:hypothetical protein